MNVRLHHVHGFRCDTLRWQRRRGRQAETYRRGRSRWASAQQRKHTKQSEGEAEGAEGE
eukprot:COSAG01_NODE_5739_length_4065_cov_2.031266_1_plen_58_part_10